MAAKRLLQPSDSTEGAGACPGAGPVCDHPATKAIGRTQAGGSEPLQDPSASYSYRQCLPVGDLTASPGTEPMQT